jgi:hypothetical protein
LLSLIAGCEESRVTSGTAELTIITIGYTTVEIFDTVGYTALEMLQKNHEVKSEFSFAVRCIDGVCSEGGYWWPLRVNGEKASVGPQSYIVEDKDKIEFVLSKK